MAISIVHAAPGITYTGPYDRARDLRRLYEEVDFAWAVDYYEAGGNSEWLLPNRLYEGGYFRTAMIASAKSQTANESQRENKPDFWRSGKFGNQGGLDNANSFRAKPRLDLGLAETADDGIVLKFILLHLAGEHVVTNRHVALAPCRPDLSVAYGVTRLRPGGLHCEPLRHNSSRTVHRVRTSP